MEFLRNFSLNGQLFKKGSEVPKSITKKQLEELVKRGVVGEMPENDRRAKKG
jgi:hypothetical protein